MTRYFLKSLAIEGFRGINNYGEPLVLRFRPDAINSVHAPNGAGKSSIFEAIHFAIHGTVPRLQALQDAEHGDSYIVNKFHPSQCATITLIFASDDSTPDVAITVTRNAAGQRRITSPSNHANPAEFVATLKEDFVLVDYSRFAKFVDASALDRGRSFASLVGLSRYSRLRRMLEGAKRTQNINSDLGLSTLETEVTTATTAIGGIERRILAAHNDITGGEATSLELTEPLKAAVTSALATVPLFKPLIDVRSVMNLDFDAAEKAVEQEEGGLARKELDTLTGTVSVLSALAV
jgi:hypothetical protein